MADLPALRPSFTLATLSADPVSGLTAWRSLTLTGAALRRLPLGGPGTPAGPVLTGMRQPGAETAVESQLTDLGGGTFAFTFATALDADFDPARTLRVGAWLGAVPGTDAHLGDRSTSRPPAARWPGARPRSTPAATAATAGSPPTAATARGLRLCLTCHTIRLADPDTVDPAALRRALSVLPAARTVVAGTGPTTTGAVAAAPRHRRSGRAGPSRRPAAPARSPPPAGPTVTLHAARLGGARHRRDAHGPRRPASRPALPITVLPRRRPARRCWSARRPSRWWPAARRWRSPPSSWRTSGDVTWSLSPPSGAGSLSATAWPPSPTSRPPPPAAA